MIAFTITVRATNATYRYAAIARNPFVLADAIVDLFGVCPFSIIPRKETSHARP